MLETYRNLTLDRFQSEALDAIGKGESVIVAAPTGAGKTLIAEYAIEKALKEGRRVVYTAPIKALSNQKFRDFSATYPGDVGITTGDVSINPQAPAVIMTTEIFRNTIFDAPERLKDVACVIFDEIHYMDDPERGTVWEESLIFAPPEIKIVALSATISNLDDFAAWLKDVRGGEVRVVLETNRPIPLSIFAATPKHGIRPYDRLRQIAGEARADRERAMRRFHGGRRFHSESWEDRARQLDRSWKELVITLAHRRELPVLFFLFSRDACERLAVNCLEFDFFMGNEERRKAAIAELTKLVFAYDLDLETPAVQRLRKLIGRGIAYHHAGLLPALKEIVEVLFSDGHLRLLIATETFALGINMPARAVVFEGLKKWNGTQRVALKTREFQQMAGRAGRRGIDTRGDVFVAFDPARDDARVLESVVKGKVEPIESQFNLSYSTILNLYSRLGERVFEACAKSFANWRSEHELKEELARPKQKRGRWTEEEEAEHRRKKGGGGRRSRPGRHERLKMRAVREGRPVGSLRYDDMVLQVSRKLDLLHELEYLDGTNLTEKGKFASSVYGHELSMTELVFQGIFDKLNPAQVATVTAAVVYEGRTAEEPGGVDPRRAVGDAWRWATKAIRNLQDREGELGIRYPVKLLDWNLTGVVWAWANGADFAKLRDYADTSDGDIVRNLRQTIQLMRLVSNPLLALARGDLHNRFASALKLIKRGLVDAEWQLRRAAELEAERVSELGKGISHKAELDHDQPEQQDEDDYPDEPDEPMPPDSSEEDEGPSDDEEE
ncbi:MAG TPA: DEAD/DEAH box helicase [Planctomycetota bacterium]|nr:DEAD/DEAH box helicase [Planctomycetota bacterium]